MSEEADSASWLERLFPRSAGADYRGHPVALWIFVPFTLLTLGRSLVHIFRADGGAQSIATIPLDRYSQDAADTVVLIFAYWGLSQLLLGFVFVAVLVRYRAWLPFMWLLVGVEYLGRLGLSAWKPIVTIETPPGATGNVVFSALAVVMLVLALWDWRSRSPN